MNATEKAALVAEKKAALKTALKALDTAWQAGDEATRAAGAHSNTSALFLSYTAAAETAAQKARDEYAAALAA